MTPEEVANHKRKAHGAAERQEQAPLTPLLQQLFTSTNSKLVRVFTEEHSMIQNLFIPLPF